MRCSKYIELIVDRCEGGISESDEVVLVKHLQECPACRMAAEEFAASDHLIEYLKSDASSIKAPVSIDSRVLVAITEKRERQERRGEWFRRLHFSLVPVSVALGVVLLIFGIWGVQKMVEEKQPVKEVQVQPIVQNDPFIDDATADQLHEAANRMLSEEFDQGELDMLFTVVNGDLEERIAEMDKNVLRIFNRLLVRNSVNNKSG